MQEHTFRRWLRHGFKLKLGRWKSLFKRPAHWAGFLFACTGKSKRPIHRASLEPPKDGGGSSALAPSSPLGPETQTQGGAFPGCLSNFQKWLCSCARVSQCKLRRFASDGWGGTDSVLTDPWDEQRVFCFCAVQGSQAEIRGWDHVSNSSKAWNQRTIAFGIWGRWKLGSRYWAFGCLLLLWLLCWGSCLICAGACSLSRISKGSCPLVSSYYVLATQTSALSASLFAKRTQWWNFGCYSTVTIFSSHSLASRTHWLMRGKRFAMSSQDPILFTS